MLCRMVSKVRFWGVSERQWAFFVLSKYGCSVSPKSHWRRNNLLRDSSIVLTWNTCGFLVHRCRTTLRCLGRLFAAWIPHCQPLLPFVFGRVSGSRSCIPAWFQAGPIHEDCPKRNARCPGSYYTKTHPPFSRTISFPMHRTIDRCCVSSTLPEGSSQNHPNHWYS